MVVISVYDATMAHVLNILSIILFSVAMVLSRN